MFATAGNRPRGTLEQVFPEQALIGPGIAEALVWTDDDGVHIAGAHRCWSSISRGDLVNLEEMTIFWAVHAELDRNLRVVLY